jgi:hypothetical protein
MLSTMFTKKEREVIDFLLDGVPKEELYIILKCEKEAIDRIFDALLSKTESTTLPILYKRLTAWHENRSIKEIAKEQWNLLYPSDSHSMNAAQIEIAWQHWIKAFEICEDLFRNKIMVMPTGTISKQKATPSPLRKKMYYKMRKVEAAIKKQGEEAFLATATEDQKETLMYIKLSKKKTITNELQRRSPESLS